MKNKIIVLLSVVMLFFVVIPAEKVFSTEEKEEYNIAIVTSKCNSERKKTLLKIIDEIKKDTEKYELNFYIEEIEYINDSSYINSFIKLFESKYSLEGIDYIGTIDDEAFGIIRNMAANEESRLYKTPIIFTEVVEEKQISDGEKEYITGKYFDCNITELLGLIYELNSNVNNINLIVSDDKFSHKTIEALKNNDSDYEFDLNIIQEKYINNFAKYLDDIKQDENTVTIVGGMFKDKNNKSILSNDVISAIQKNFDGPIYTNDELYLNAGILGACISSIEDSVNEVVYTIIDNIESKSISEMPIKYEEYFNYYIDYISVYLNRKYLLNSQEDGVFIHNSLKDIMKMIEKQPAYKIAKAILFVIICLVIYLIEYTINLRRKKSTDKLILEERKKVKSDFVALVNHEFRTPINIILNSSNLIKRNINNEQYVYEKLEGIDNNSYRLYRLINNLLYMLNVENDMGCIWLTSTNVVEVIEDAVQEAVQYANKKNIELIFDTEEEEIISSIDIVLIQKAILNIISNSIKFTEPGGKIDIFMELEGEDIKIKVTDTGIGVEKEHLENLFVKFYQISPALTRTSEGGGIGLYVVKEIIEQHNGEIEFISEFNVGSTVIITLPRVYEQDTECKHIDNMIDIKEIAQIEMSDLIHY